MKSPLSLTTASFIGLRVLDISSNELTKLTPSIAMLTNLHELHASANELTNLVPEIGVCCGLTRVPPRRRADLLKHNVFMMMMMQGNW